VAYALNLAVVPVDEEDAFISTMKDSDSYSNIGNTSGQGSANNVVHQPRPSVPALFNIETVHAIRPSKLRQWTSVPGTASSQGVSSLARTGQEN